MAYDRFMIAPLNSGLQTDVKPWLISDKAFARLTNAYVFRGSVRKRFGSKLINTEQDASVAQLYSRLRVQVGTLKVPDPAVPGTIFEIGQAFSVGNLMFTVHELGLPGNMLVADLIVGVTDPLTGNAAGTTPTGNGALLQTFRIGTQVFNVAVAVGALVTAGPATGTFNIGTGAFTFTGADLEADIIWTTNYTGTFNTTTGVFAFPVIAYPINTPIYFYPAQPVMGLITYERSPINDEPTYAFDTQFAYQYVGGGWERLGTAIWTGKDSQFFSGDTWRGAQSPDNLLFVTNFNAADRIKYWNGAAVPPALPWTNFHPVLSRLNRLYTARIIIPFKDRLLFLNTIENAEGVNVGTTNGVGNYGPTAIIPVVNAVGQTFLVENCTFTVTDITPGAHPLEVALSTSNVVLPGAMPTGTFNTTTNTLTIIGNTTNPNTVIYFLNNAGVIGNNRNYRNRCRFSQNGSPIIGYAWLDDYTGLGGYIDCPTQEAIIAAQSLKDRLIVFFERSTWELVYTNNQVLPFKWQQLNTELGVESTFSVIPFDQVLLGIGNVGIHACTGNSVSRIDSKIPNTAIDIHNENEGLERVCGVRDYQVEMVYWSYPDPSRGKDGSPTFPTSVLVYNYVNGSWAMNEDSITAFGYYQNVSDITWATSNKTWEEVLETWNSGTLQGEFRQVIAGNQEGYVFLVLADEPRNAVALQITDILVVGHLVSLTIINHNLFAGDYILIESVQGTTGLNKIFKIEDVDTVDVITFVLTDAELALVAGAYTGAGTVARVSKVDILTKQYNFYQDKGRNASISTVDFLVDKTSAGQITVDYFASSSNETMIGAGIANASILGTSVLETSPYELQTLETTQTRVWHPVYLQTDGECIQLRLYMSDEQMRNIGIAHSDFQLNAMLFKAKPTSFGLR